MIGEPRVEGRTEQPDPEKCSIELACSGTTPPKAGAIRGRVANVRATSRAFWPSRHDGRSPGQDSCVSSSSLPTARPRSCGCTVWDPRRSTSSVAPSPPGAYLSPMATVHLRKGGMILADNGTDAQPHHQPPEANPALERLDPLVGEWTIEGIIPSDPPLVVRGRVAFEWLTGAPSSLSAGTSHTPTSPMASPSSARTPRPRLCASTTSTRVASSVSM